MDEVDWYSDERATFGDRVTLAREALGLSRTDLAERLGVEEARVEGWEADADEPRANRLQMMAGVLGVSLQWLMTGQGEPPAPAPEGDVAPILAEMRAVRGDMTRAAERLGLLERRLRAALGT